MREVASGNCAALLSSALVAFTAVVASVEVFHLDAEGVHPLLFGLARTAIAGLGLGCAWACGAAACGGLRRALPSVRALVTSDGTQLVVTTSFLFCAELFNILGIRMAGADAASLWLPAQPLCTAMLTALLGIERFSAVRSAGLAIAVVSCVATVSGTTSGAEPGGVGALGTLSLLLGGLSGAAYIVSSKPLLQRGHAPILLGSASLLGCAFLLSAALGGSRWLHRLDPELHAIILCDRARDTLCGASSSTLGARGWTAALFHAAVGTALPRRLELFANRVLRSSLVSAFCALQPVAAVAIVSTVILASPAPHLGLRSGGAAGLCGLGVLAGLCLIVRDETLWPLAVQPAGTRGLLEGGAPRSSDAAGAAAAGGE
eukprot:4068879-Prymnesium_polylepis.1